MRFYDTPRGSILCVGKHLHFFGKWGFRSFNIGMATEPSGPCLYCSTSSQNWTRFLSWASSVGSFHVKVVWWNLIIKSGCSLVWMMWSGTVSCFLRSTLSCQCLCLEWGFSVVGKKGTMSSLAQWVQHQGGAQTVNTRMIIKQSLGNKS